MLKANIMSQVKSLACKPNKFTPKHINNIVPGSWNHATVTENMSRLGGPILSITMKMKLVIFWKIKM